MKYKFKKHENEKEDKTVRTMSYSSETCWNCGIKMKKEGVPGDPDEKKSTRHHAIPKHMNPLMNVVIPVCQGCHREIHGYEPNGE